MPIPFARSRGFRELQSLILKPLGKLWLLSSPFVLPLGGPSGIRGIKAFMILSNHKTSSHALRRHLSVLSLRSPPPKCPVVDPQPLRKVLAWAFTTLQHIKMQETFFSLFSKRPENVCPVSRKFPPQGLATLTRISFLSPVGTSFSSQRSWVSLFRAFLLRKD